MAKVVSFNTDAPPLKANKLRSWENLYTLQISSDYLSFAGRRSLRAFVLTASDGAKAYSMEFADKKALLGWFLDLDFEIEHIDPYIEQAATGRTVHFPFCVDEGEAKALGFKQPGKPFTPPPFR